RHSGTGTLDAARTGHPVHRCEGGSMGRTEFGVFEAAVCNKRVKPIRFAIFGAGFWARYQLAAWRELAGVEGGAIFNRPRARAESLAGALEIPAVYGDAEELLLEVKPDFVDNITEVGGHKPLSLLCAKHRVPCICQKPMAASLSDARAMVNAFRKARTPL